MECLIEKREKQFELASEWVTMTFTPDKIILSPSDVVTKLTEETEHLYKKVKEQALELYWSRNKMFEDKGKEFADVGMRQQQRQLAQNSVSQLYY